MITKLISLYLFVGVLLLSFMFVSSFLRGKTRYARAFGALSLTLQIYLLGYLLEINATSLKEMIFWNQIQYFGIPFFPALWLWVSMLYTGRGSKWQGVKLLAIFAVPIITFIMRATNEWHHLYYSKIELQSFAGMSPMLLTKGPWYVVQMTYVLITLITCTWFYYKRYKDSVGIERIQFRLLLIASVLPYVSLVLVTMNLGGVGIDYTAIILPPCVLLINLALTKYNFLEIKVMAREHIFEESEEGIVLINRLNQVVDYNEKSIALFQLFDSQLHEGPIEKLLENQKELLGAIMRFENKIYMIETKDTPKFVNVISKGVHNHNEMVGLLITISDVTEREELRRRLEQMAVTDELSGLNNRRRFREYGEEAVDRALRYHEQLSILMMDIDYFKRINDTYGHGVGNQVIKSFSAHLKHSFRGTDTVARMGGEEFAVIMINTDMATAYEKAEGFRRHIYELEERYGDYVVHYSISIGISTITEEAQTLDQLINLADEALYEAKNTGRNKTMKRK